MGKKIFKIGTRTSPLALKQVDEVLRLLHKFYPDIKADIIRIDTYGDKDKVTPISDIEGTDFFTREIEDSLLNSRIDFAVHSAKDMPDALPGGLRIAAITESIDPHDALVSKKGLRLDELPHGAAIGTSSARRKAQLKAYRGDFSIVDIRGNIEERLKLVDETDLDAIVIAACGLIRLGLDSRISQRIPLEILRPHPLQGSLVVETRNDRSDLIELFSNIDSRRKKDTFQAEQETLSRLDWKASLDL